MTRLKSREVDRQAAEWAAKLDSGPLGPEEQATLDRWLEADTRHFGAFAKARAVLAFTDRAKAFGQSLIGVLGAHAQNLPSNWLSSADRASRRNRCKRSSRFRWFPPVWRALRTRSYETLVKPESSHWTTAQYHSEHGFKIEVEYRRASGYHTQKGEALFDVQRINCVLSLWMLPALPFGPLERASR
jgi:hypothetical protein